MFPEQDSILNRPLGRGPRTGLNVLIGETVRQQFFGIRCSEVASRRMNYFVLIAIGNSPDSLRLKLAAPGPPDVPGASIGRRLVRCGVWVPKVDRMAKAARDEADAAEEH